MTRDMPRETSIDALVEKHLHFTKPGQSFAPQLLEKRHDLFSLDGRKALEKSIDRLSTLETIDQRLDGNPRSGEYGGAAQNIGR